MYLRISLRGRLQVLGQRFEYLSELLELGVGHTVRSRATRSVGGRAADTPGRLLLSRRLCTDSFSIVIVIVVMIVLLLLLLLLSSGGAHREKPFSVRTRRARITHTPAHPHTRTYTRAHDARARPRTSPFDPFERRRSSLRIDFYGFRLPLASPRVTLTGGGAPFGLFISFLIIITIIFTSRPTPGTTPGDVSSKRRRHKKRCLRVFSSGLGLRRGVIGPNSRTPSPPRKIARWFVFFPSFPTLRVFGRSFL